MTGERWGPMQIPGTSQILGQISAYLVQMINGHGLAPVLKGPVIAPASQPKLPDEQESLPTVEERRAWREEKSPSFPAYWKKKREERRGKDK